MYYILMLLGCPPNYAQYGKRCYHYQPFTLSWEDADTMCTQEGKAWVGNGKLAKAGALELTEFLSGLFKGYVQFRLQLWPHFINHGNRYVRSNVHLWLCLHAGLECVQFYLVSLSTLFQSYHDSIYL